MNGANEDSPARFDSPDAVYFTLSRGTDISALLEDLENDICQSPHLGYVVSGALTVTYTDGSEDVDEGGDVFYWPPGHTIRADEDTDFVLFSSRREHGEVIDHVRNEMETAEAR